jgi:hypothetical protein
VVVVVAVPDYLAQVVEVQHRHSRVGEFLALLGPAGPLSPRPGTVRGEAFVMGQGETAIALITPRNLIGFPGVLVAVAIGVIVCSPLATQTVLPSGVIARK